ncbi:MAG: hypothetical protein FWG72_04585 [Oscillospiraceae bacterium]|nr:hypothetical protein [Oscillospiraceae bacterium]
MSNTTFGHKKHADALLEIEGLVCDVLMLAEGMTVENDNLDPQKQIQTFEGAFRLICPPLEKAFETLTELEVDFRSSHGLKYGEEETA